MLDSASSYLINAPPLVKFLFAVTIISIGWALAATIEYLLKEAGGFILDILGDI